MPESTPKEAPALDFDRLWKEHYANEFALTAKKHRKVHEYGSADELWTDMWEKVWQKAVKTWPDHFAKSKDPNFDRWVKYLMKHYLIDLGRRTHTGPRQFQQNMVSFDKPVTDDEGEGSATVGDFVSELDKAFDKIDSDADTKKLLDGIDDPDLKTAVKMIIQHTGPLGELWKKIQQATGKPRSYIQRQLQSNPYVREFLAEALSAPPRKSKEPDAEEEAEVPESEPVAVAAPGEAPLVAPKELQRLHRERQQQEADEFEGLFN